MTFDLSKDEVTILVGVLEQVPVRGTESMRVIIELIDKLKSGLEKVE